MSVHLVSCMMMVTRLTLQLEKKMLMMECVCRHLSANRFSDDGDNDVNGKIIMIIIIIMMVMSTILAE